MLIVFDGKEAAMTAQLLEAKEHIYMLYIAYYMYMDGKTFSALKYS